MAPLSIVAFDLLSSEGTMSYGNLRSGLPVYQRGRWNQMQRGVQDL